MFPIPHLLMGYHVIWPICAEWDLAQNLPEMNLVRWCQGGVGTLLLWYFTPSHLIEVKHGDLTPDSAGVPTC